MGLVMADEGDSAEKAGGKRLVDRPGLVKALLPPMPALVLWAWAINGSASVLSAVLATILARQLGFQMVVITASLLYVGAGLALRARPAASLEPQTS
jgi:hypothetical protein